MKKGQEMLKTILADNPQIGIDPTKGITFQRDVSQEDFIAVARALHKEVDPIYFTSHTANASGMTHYRLWTAVPKTCGRSNYPDWGSQEDIALVEMITSRESKFGKDRDHDVFQSIAGCTSSLLARRYAKRTVESNLKTMFEQGELPVADDVRIYTISRDN